MEEEEKRGIYLLCQSLKSPYREVAIAHFCRELSAQEIASESGKNAKTVQTQIYRARAMLKKQMGRSG